MSVSLVSGAAYAPGGVSGQDSSGLSGRGQLRDRLMEVRAHAADQPGRAHQRDQHLPVRFRVTGGTVLGSWS